MPNGTGGSNKKQPGFFPIKNGVPALIIEELGFTALGVYIAITQFVDRNTLETNANFRVKLKKIAEYCGISPQHAGLLCQQLRDAGFIEYTPGRGFRHAHFRLNPEHAIRRSGSSSHISITNNTQPQSSRPEVEPDPTPVQHHPEVHADLIRDIGNRKRRG